MTVYADDFHAAQVNYTSEDLQQIIQNLGILLDLMQDFDLVLNAAKSTVLLRIQGSEALELLKVYTHNHKGTRHLQVPRADGSFTLLPIHSQTCYLGMMLTYKKPQTVEHRSQTGYDKLTLPSVD